MDVSGFWDAKGAAALQSLGVYALGILVYGLVVNFYYQILSHRVMLGRKQGSRRVSTSGRTFLYLLAFPFISFSFFLILSAALLFLADEGHSPVAIFTTAMAILLAVRIAAYLSESTAHDLAKLLPLGLLGVILVRQDFETTWSESLGRLRSIWGALDVILFFLLVVVTVEYILRGLWSLTGRKERRLFDRPGPGAPPTP